MADGGDKSVGKTFLENEKDVLEKYDKKVKAEIHREKRMKKFHEWRGNKLPPFSIEHMPHERQRLGGSGMTDADRQLRRQWVMDQVLAENEPKVIKELKPRNPIRLLMGKPWDVMQSVLEPVIGTSRANLFRMFTPKIAILTLGIWAGWYNLKYHRANWETTTGWHIYGNMKRILPGEPGWPSGYKDRDIHEFNDKGFRQRKVILDRPGDSGEGAARADYGIKSWYI